MIIIIIIVLGLILSMIDNVSKKKEQQSKEKERKEAFQNYNSIKNKAEVLFSQKRYSDALVLYKQANDTKPFYHKDSDITLKTALCKFYLKDYNAVIDILKNTDNDTACICNAISFFELGDYSQSKRIFKDGINKKYPQVIKLYSDYFNPSKNKLLYWNTLEENAKALLAKNAKISYNSKTFSESDIEAITNCRNLDLSCITEKWYEGEFGLWEKTAYESQYKITDLEFCKYIPRIRKINICGQPISNFEGLENQRRLIEINASRTHISNLEALNGCINLQSLNLNASIKNVEIDLSPIMNIPLVKLDLSFSNIKNIEILNHIITLKELSLIMTGIKNLAQIKSLNKLEILNVGCSDNFKLTANCNLMNIKFLSIGYVLSKEEDNHFKTTFSNCKIEYSLLGFDIFNKEPFNKPYHRYKDDELQSLLF